MNSAPTAGDAAPSALHSAICRALFLSSALASLSTTAAAAVIHVPADSPTIQNAINIANAGDTVLVSAGMYRENINFSGKAIRVVSRTDPSHTIIDGGKKAPVVMFATGESTKSVLRGFTLQNGVSNLDATNDGNGGGVDIRNASPIVENNIIQKNLACNGGGIGVLGTSAPEILNNQILNNGISNCSGGFGGGIYISSGGNALISGNTIQGNSNGTGGGVALLSAGVVRVTSNIIENNVNYFGGGGIYASGATAPYIANNLIVRNTSGTGEFSVAGGLYLQTNGFNGASLTLVNNTIADNTANETSDLSVGSGTPGGMVANNIVYTSSGLYSVTCGGSVDLQFSHNDFFSPNGAEVYSSCGAIIGVNGNRSDDPQFVGGTADDAYTVRFPSPMIDSGDNAAAQGLIFDLVHNPRIVDGSGDNFAVVDIGAYEYQ